MTDDVKQRRTNDSLQGGEGNPAYGVDASDFGEGGQRQQRPLEPGHDDARERELGRDRTVPRSRQPAESER